MVLENATIPLSIPTAFGSITGNSLKPVGILRLVVVKAINLKCPKDKGNDRKEEMCKHFQRLLAVPAKYSFSIVY